MSFLFGPRVEEADVKETSTALGDEDGEALLIDVREPHEWRAGRARGARHIPLGELPDHLDRLPRAAPVYLICRSGNRSHTAAKYLKQAGFERPINVRGGMLAWERAGLPVER
jgi:rhodanese-related sulfurtransferase